MESTQFFSTNFTVIPVFSQTLLNDELYDQDLLNLCWTLVDVDWMLVEPWLDVRWTLL